MKSPVQLTQPELEAEAKRLKIDFTQDVKRVDLIKAVADRRKELGETGSDTTTQNKGKNATTGNSGGKKAVFYWIKMPSYIDDDRTKSDKLLSVGLYKFNRVLPRLEGSPITAVEKFEGEIPERALLLIGEAVGIHYDASEKVDYDDLLQKLITKVDFK